jgi:DNA-binding transcriptional regulator YiaG
MNLYGRGDVLIVCEVKARNFTRTTEVTPNEVALVRQGTGLSQAEFAVAPSISKRTLQA